MLDFFYFAIQNAFPFFCIIFIYLVSIFLPIKHQINNYVITPLFLPSLGLSGGVIFLKYFKISVFWIWYFIATFSVISIISFVAILKSKKNFDEKNPEQKSNKFINFSFLIVHISIFFFMGIAIHHLEQKNFDIAFEKINNDQKQLFVVNDIVFNQQSSKFKYKLLISPITNLQILNSWQVSLYLRKNFLSIGDAIELHNFKLQDGSIYDKASKILGIIFYQPQKMYIKKIGHLGLSPTQYLNIFKKKNTEALLKKMDPLTQSFFGMLFLGQKEREVAVELRSVFNKWGISHFLARSGLHLTLFSLFASSIFFILPIPLILRYLFLLFLSLFYYFLTFTSTSFLRAELMLLCFIFARLLNKEHNNLHVLHLCYLIFILFNPKILFTLDFQLTFLLVFVLITFEKLFPNKKMGPASKAHSIKN